MTPEAEAAIDGAFDTLARAVPGAGVEAQQMFQSVYGERLLWSGSASDAEKRINALYDDEEFEFMPLAEKQARIAKIQAQFTATHAESERALRTKLGILESQAHVAAESDLELAPAADRALIRSDIERAIANLPAKASRTSALLALVAANPKKYGAELVKDDFGASLLKSVGEESGAATLRASVIAMTPGSTPKAVAGRALLKAIPQAIGAVGGLKFGHGSRVETAAKPRQKANHVPVNLTRS